LDAVYKQGIGLRHLRVWNLLTLDSVVPMIQKMTPAKSV